MEHYLFTVTCTTCQARLQVRDAAAIGAILACPKCESMVHVVPPKGWVPPPSLSSELADQSPDSIDRPVEHAVPKAGGSESKGLPGKPERPVGRPEDSVAGKGVGAGSKNLSQQRHSHVERPRDTKAPTDSETGSKSGARKGALASTAAAAIVAPGVASGSPGSPEQSSLSRPPRSPRPPSESPSLPLSPEGSAPIGWNWQPWIVWGAASMGAVALVASLWSILPRPAARPLAPVAQSISKVEPPAAAVATSPGPQRPLSLEQQWLPADARLLVSAQLSALVQMRQSHRWLNEAHPLWQQVIVPPLESFGLKPAQVDRLVLATTDLSAGVRADLLVIKCVAGTAVARKASSVDLVLAGVPCQRLEAPGWSHPFAQVDAETIVTGQESILRQLAAAPRQDLDSLPLRRLLSVLPSETALSVRLDLDAARTAGWSLPSTWSDVWSPGREAWHAVWEVPDGLGLTLRTGDTVQSELAICCEAASTADKVLALLESLFDQGRQAIAAQLDTITDRLQAGRFSAAVADQYELLLRRGLSSMRTARISADGEVVLLRLDWELPLPALALAVLECRGALHGDWLDAARAVDEANHRRLLAGLGGYHKAEGSFPAGAVGGSLLPPETRLSWLAAMLPYFGQSDWHRQLEFGYPWNAPQNKAITKRPLAAVVNPALGSAVTEAGFPVSHYVGCAGVGADAGTLKSDDPRAGVFGFGRSTRSEDIADGASNTIAVLPVAHDPGAWAAGGAATVRGLTAAPYVNGPDGFGSGRPDGMFVGMADGAVRFVSKDIDPRVLEQLATVRGGERTNLALLDPKPRPAPSAGPVSASRTQPVAASPQPAAAVRPAAVRPAIDVRSGLAVKIPQIELKDAPLEDAIGLAAQLGQVPVGFDLDAMARLNVGLSDPVSVKLADASVAEMLRTVAAARHLSLVVSDNQVLITSPAEERQKLRHDRYDVSDLTGYSPTGLQELAALIREMVAPESWKEAGGPGTIALQGPNLSIEQVAAVHWQVLHFCERLRAARRLPLRGAWEPQELELRSRHQRAEERLARVVTVNLPQAVSLQKAVALLENEAKLRILVDWAALTAAGIAMPVSVTVRLDRQPLAAALDQLLTPLGLGYRIVNPGLLQISTRKAVSERLELEFYSVSDLLARYTPQSLVEQIRSTVAKNTWNDAGGAAAISFDGPSQCLIVFQSQPAQVAIERVLEQVGGRNRRPPATQAKAAPLP